MSKHDITVNVSLTTPQIEELVRLITVNVSLTTPQIEELVLRCEGCWRQSWEGGLLARTAEMAEAQRINRLLDMCASSFRRELVHRQQDSGIDIG